MHESVSTEASAVLGSREGSATVSCVCIGGCGGGGGGVVFESRTAACGGTGGGTWGVLSAVLRRRTRGFVAMARGGGVGAVLGVTMPASGVRPGVAHGSKMSDVGRD